MRLSISQLSILRTFASAGISTVDRMEEGLPDERLSMLVNQATGMVAAQLDCGVIEAFDQLSLRAKTTGQSLEHVALDVIDRILRFDSKP
jgi:ANTAR domain